jgi:hypothetical protein
MGEELDATEIHGFLLEDVDKDSADRLALFSGSVTPATLSRNNWMVRRKGRRRRRPFRRDGLARGTIPLFNRRGSRRTLCGRYALHGHVVNHFRNFFCG